MALSPASRQNASASDVALVSKRSSTAGRDIGPSSGVVESADAPAPRITRMADPVLADRHAWLAGLLAPAPGERVVDLGCGESAVLGLAGPRLDGGLAVGVDSDTAALRAARTVPGMASWTPFVAADLADPLPLVSGSMDAVFCHDVLELLPDPDALLREVWRVLRPGGRFVLGHADFDTAVFAGADVRLTRRLVHAYCDTQQSWMPRAEGTIGRRLPEIVLRSPLTLDHVTARCCSPGACKKAGSAGSRSTTSSRRSPRPARLRRRSWAAGGAIWRRRPVEAPSC
jgi:SAM-dependent methyltransferase